MKQRRFMLGFYLFKPYTASLRHLELIYLEGRSLLTLLSLQEVDAVTAECLALREQVAIYEEQLANMEAQNETVREE